MMAGEMNSLGHVWNVHGKNVTPMYDEDVYELIRENICDDCADYVKEMMEMSPADKAWSMSDEEILSSGLCSGECNKVQRTQEHYESLLKECYELASEIYHEIVDDWNPGKRRTKKEQLAVDKANKICGIVKQNT